VGEMVEKEGIVEMDLNPVFVYENGCVVADARIAVGERKRFDYTLKDVSEIINPKSVAVIGASTNPIKVGNSVVKSLMSNKNLRIYPINPAAKVINGLKAYPSLSVLPETPDLAIIAVPAEKVLEAALDAANAGVKGAVIISSGFKEAEYGEGKELEKMLRDMAEQKNFRIVGPNTFGIVNVIKGINASFTPMFSNVKKGRIALVSQSGGICHYIMHKFLNAGFSYILHLGNRCDIDFPDVLNFLKDSNDTDVVALYIEGVENGRALFGQIREMAEKKRIVVMKSGKSSVADRASLSHTGSMAGDYRVFESAMRQAGAFVAENPVELIDIATALERLDGLDEARGKGVGILTIQAGMGIVAADTIETGGGRVAKFDENTIMKLRKLLPPITMRENPVDLSFSGLDLGIFTGVVDAVSNDSDTGIIMFLYAEAPPSWVIPPEVIRTVAERFKKPGIFVYSTTPENYQKMDMALQDCNAVLFDSVERAARVAAKLCK
ncbi:acetate--CoA ligase family protein, partial [Archaeoglobus neptunius]|uniref:acetate--CoA ligase family protein n=1 Tax=Archaeoglobus neptunius TaxID=2798580 RepID=UPI00192930C8